MTKRANLPYTYQDLLPQGGRAASESAATPGSVSGASFSESLRGNHLAPARAPRSTWSHWKRMLRRLARPQTLDFETAVWEAFHLIVNPRKMYRSNYTYKHSGSASYSRDDPSFLLLVTAFLCVSAVAWGAAYSPRWTDIATLVCTMVVVDFYLVGIAVATVSWFVANRLFTPAFGVRSLFSPAARYGVHYIDWPFCFDVHCNSFLTIWCSLYLVQFFLLPLLTRDSFLALLVGNSLYFGSVGHYFVVTFYGFNSLPFVASSTYSRAGHANPARRLQMAILAGVLPALAVAWFLSVVFHFNVAYHMVHSYFD